MIDRSREMPERQFSKKSKVTLAELQSKTSGPETFASGVAKTHANAFLADPAANGRLTEIASCLLTFDPLITLSLFLPTTMERLIRDSGDISMIAIDKASSIETPRPRCCSPQASSQKSQTFELHSEPAIWTFWA